MTTFSFNYFGSTIEAKTLGIDFLPDIQETLTSHCVPLTVDGKIVAVNIINRGIDIPGGHIDDNETAIEAMQREAHEEARISIENPVLIDVWRLTSANNQLGLSQKPYLLLYTANVVSMEDFVPNHEADERLILEPEDFIAKYFGDKQQARVMVERALAARV
ncbi:MAG TPA: NUDIX domain-containing protein [Candidatus Microsaccharimonas sp.]|jgi:8-oxo-dGTP pyrophosphatase MutT (NUDIX family)